MESSVVEVEFKPSYEIFDYSKNNGWQPTGRSFQSRKEAFDTLVEYDRANDSEDRIFRVVEISKKIIT